MGALWMTAQMSTIIFVSYSLVSAIWSVVQLGIDVRILHWTCLPRVGSFCSQWTNRTEIRNEGEKICIRLISSTSMHAQIKRLIKFTESKINKFNKKI